MENNHRRNKFIFHLPNRKSLKVVPINNGEKKNLSLDLKKTAKQFYAEIENANKEIVVLRCLPLNVKTIRLESGCQKEPKTEKKAKSPENPKENISAPTQEDLQSIDQSLKNLYCYMKTIRKNSDMPLDLTHYCNILCRLQDIRDSFRDFKDSAQLENSNAKSKESKKKDEKNGKITKEEKNKKNGKDKEEKSGKNTKEEKNNKNGKNEEEKRCCFCSKKKCDDGKDSCQMVPCVVLPDSLCEKEQQTSSALVNVASSKNLYEIQICKKGKKGCTCDQQVQTAPSKTSEGKLSAESCERKKEKMERNENCTNGEIKPKITFEGCQKNACRCAEKAIQTEKCEEKGEKDNKIEKNKKEDKKAEKAKPDKKQDKGKTDNKVEKNKKEDKKAEKEKSNKNSDKKQKNDKKKELPNINVSEKNESENFCESCYGKKVPLIKTNLYEELEKITGQRRGTVFLKISAIDENLYHIQCSTTANKNVGCLYVTNKAMCEAKKQRVFDEYITICVAKSTCSVPNVKQMVDYPFELCDR